MSIPQPDDVRPVLRDFELRIRAILEAAWKEWLEVPDRARFSDRSRASIVFDFIKRRAIAEFDRDPNIRIIIKGQTVQFLFRDTVLVRFKKACRSGLGSNIETQAVLEFVDPQLKIPDLLPDIYRIEVCYHLDSLATQLEELAVTARDRDRKLWSYELQKTETAEIIPLPRSPEPSDLPPPDVRPREPKPDSETESPE